jgi:hypothetical protein
VLLTDGQESYDSEVFETGHYHTAVSVASSSRQHNLTPQYTAVATLQLVGSLPFLFSSMLLMHCQHALCLLLF